METVQTKIPTDTWIPAAWDDYITEIETAAEKAKGYYYSGEMRIEMLPVGPRHAYDDQLLSNLIFVFSLIKRIPLRSLGNCSYRKVGQRECQPDISYYIGDRIQLAPQGSSVVNLDTVAPPDLAIEIADSSLLDDLGMKRMLYEAIGVSEYWVVDVNKVQIIAFQMLANGGSQRILVSQVLPGLEMALMESALQQSRQVDHSQVGAWFLTQIQ
jgi:Uma2 family endonuclease